MLANTKFSYFSFGLLVGILLSLFTYAMYLKDYASASGDAGSATKLLKLGHALPVSHPVHQALLKMDERLKALSSGALSLEIYPSGVMGTEVQSVEQLQQGVLAMTKTSAAALESFADEMSVFGLPYLFRDEDHYWAVLSSQLGQDILTRLEAKKVRGLTYYDAGSRSFYSADKLIKTPDDLIGQKIRVMNSRVAMDAVTMLGAAPTPIAWGELYSALAQGTVDGAENNPPSYVAAKHYEVSPKFSLDEHTRIPDVLLVSSLVWRNLSAQEQQWLQQAASESTVYQRQLWAEKTQLALAEAKAKGVEIYYPDKRLFEAKVAPMYQAIAPTKLGEVVEKIRAIK